MADDKNNAAPAPAKAEVAVETKTAPAKNTSTDEKAMYETTGDFQLFDIATNQIVPFDGKLELFSNSPFVVTNVANGKLKKVG